MRKTRATYAAAFKAKGANVPTRNQRGAKTFKPVIGEPRKDMLLALAAIRGLVRRGLSL